jgi:hypothetical protein
MDVQISEACDQELFSEQVRLMDSMGNFYLSMLEIIIQTTESTDSWVPCNPVTLIIFERKSREKCAYNEDLNHGGLAVERIS